MPQSTIPADNLDRELSVVDPDDPSLSHLAVVGDTYTVLLSGAQTGGHFCLIDMMVPDGGGPGPHRHDFEEMFHLIEGEIEFTFRGEKRVAKAGMTVNIPANAPHSFKNVSGSVVRMLCLCAPAGQEEFFARVGMPVESRTAAAPALSKDEFGAFLAKAAALAPQFRTELLKP
ncbi:cupin domain-containing protein [Mesorhizobium sp. ES1-4]|uniref:cupin domain-containing protein n=1 Tax=Mesorhizobium sp. ES1-4 TaxID=2876627 RepID=UPI001CCC06EF|nr:cupin domain-containing protein [Mesorhizobium sp. ES1-4]MBZ9794950.1 cupin domain-containing protein [Mesorhizobium sp. ES1-4]